jgi:6-phosphogluconolactonase (cycloisomerase 2 family)
MTDGIFVRTLMSLGGLAMMAGIPQPARSAGADHIYLESNSTAGNSIYAYSFNFTSSPVLSSTTPAGGIGVYDGTFALGPFDSDQNLIENANGTMLFAVNSGSNTIAVFNIGANGSLTPVAGSPFSSGGSDPVSVGISNDILTVVNQDQDPAQDKNLEQPNYTTFHISPQGALTPVPESTVRVAYGSSPSQALIASEGAFVFGADFLGGLIQSFRLDQRGRLFPNRPRALPDALFVGSTAGHMPLGMRAHPNLPILYVDIVGLNEVAVYRYDEEGRITFVKAVADTGKGPCWAITNHSGTRLYVTNTGDTSIQVYDLTDALNPVPMQHFVMQSTTGAAFSTVIDHSDTWIYVSSEQSSASATTAANAFHTLQVASDGTLSEPFAPTVLPASAVPVRTQGVTVY